MSDLPRRLEPAELLAEVAWLRRLARVLLAGDADADDLAHETRLVAAEQAPRDRRPLRP